MEILLLVLLAGLAGWFFFLRKPVKSTPIVDNSGPPPYANVPQAPYKVEPPQPETPAWHTAPAEGSELAKNTLDVNNDGKVDLKDAVEVVKKARGRVKKAADVDGDGKVTKADAKAAVKKVKAKATKKVATMKAKTSRSKKA